MATTGTVLKVTVIDEETRISDYFIPETDPDASVAWLAMVQLAQNTQRDLVVKTTTHQIVMLSLNSIVILTGSFTEE